jgi:hypothetical protein
VCLAPHEYVPVPQDVQQNLLLHFPVESANRQEKSNWQSPSFPLADDGFQSLATAQESGENRKRSQLNEIDLEKLKKGVHGAMTDISAGKQPEAEPGFLKTYLRRRQKQVATGS